MELITLSFDVRENFGIKSSHITIDENDFIIMLKQLSDDALIFTTSYSDLKYGQSIKITFQSNFGKVECDGIIDNFYNNDVMFVAECNITAKNKNEFWIAFNNFIQDLEIQKKRKEQRILCTKNNLKLLHMNNTFILNFKYRQFKAVIADISYSGIRVLTSKNLLQDNGGLYSFKLFFTEPEENFFFVKCPIIRKNLHIFENTEFAELVFKIGDDIRFKNRIDNYFDNIKNQKYSR